MGQARPAGEHPRVQFRSRLVAAIVGGPPNDGPPLCPARLPSNRWTLPPSPAIAERKCSRETQSLERVPGSDGVHQPQPLPPVHPLRVTGLPRGTRKSVNWRRGAGRRALASTGNAVRAPHLHLAMLVQVPRRSISWPSSAATPRHCQSRRAWLTSPDSASSSTACRLPDLAPAADPHAQAISARSCARL
jgi:hypothetical protein